ncbi:ABC transporter substrate-binding protein [Cupriavidus sp. 2TAF22]|uniref:ABC transporter substrate-binding protein n=1 Tax=unclassified Cupriavidus TaxID=2640874 RepID=UPI003F925313
MHFLRTSGIACGALAVAMLVNSAANAADQLKIGFIGTLSGTNATMGNQLSDGFQLAIEQAGGNLGGLPTRVIKVDDQQKPDIGRQEANRLIESEKVQFIVGVPFSNVLNAVFTPAVQKTILIGMAGAPSAIAGASCSQYFFSSSWQGDTLAEAVGTALERKQVKRLYVMVPNFPGGREVVAGLKRKFKGEIVGEIYTPLTQLDFAPELAQLRTAKPDAVFAFFPGGLGIQFIKQYAQSGLKDAVPLYTAYTIDANTLGAMGEAAVGVRTAEFWGASMDNPANRQFIDAFQKRYKYAPSSYAAQGYDAGRMLDAAIRQANGSIDDRAAMAAALKSAKFQSVRGDFRFNNNHFPIQDLYVGEIVKSADGVPTMKLGERVLHDYGDAYAASCPLK